ncbi:MAG: NRDE family protein [Alphaproteobacteria bacterium]|nr:NRDE family protein [Alphaproteobacteria bacterium]
MCTVVLLRRPGHDWPLLLAANRDEMRDRPSRPPGRHWPDRPEIVAGLDELAGGSWLGLNDHGVVAAALNRRNSLGPAPGCRSRGELVLDALDHADAADAAEALAALDAHAFRPFNLIVADDRDAYWLSGRGDAGPRRPALAPVPAGLSMLTAYDLDDRADPRIARFHPQWTAAAVPDPASDAWTAWETLLARRDDGGDPRAAMTVALATGFATVSSALIALPNGASPHPVAPVFRVAEDGALAGNWRRVALT